MGRDHKRAVTRLHDLGIMINGSFVFGLDGDTPDVYERTVSRAIDNGITTSTFHIATPYRDTAFYKSARESGRLLTKNWDLYDTRHVVFQPALADADALKQGYDWAYEKFYRWSSIVKSSISHGTTKHQLKHFFYAGGWKKFEPLWNTMINLKRLNLMTPMLEGVLSKVTHSSKPGNVEADIDEHRTPSSESQVISLPGSTRTVT